jgi:signal transduction histidine kinase
MHIAEKSMPTADKTFILVLLSGLLYLSAIPAIRNRYAAGARGMTLLGAYLIASLSWTVSLIWAMKDQRAGIIPILGLLILGVLFIQLNLAFLLHTGKAGRSSWAAGLIWLAVCSLIIITPPETLNAIIPNRFATGTSMYLGGCLAAVGWGLFSAASIWLTIAAYRRTQHPLHRNRLKVWAVVLLMNTTAGGAFLLISPAAASFLQLAAVLTACYAFLTHNLPDLRSIFRRVVIDTSCTLLAVMVYASIFWLAVQAVDHLQIQLWLSIFTASIITAWIASPLHARLRGFLKRHLSGSVGDAHRALSAYSGSSHRILDLHPLASLTVDLAQTLFSSNRASLFLVTEVVAEDQSQWYSLHDILNDNVPGLTIPTGSLLASLLSTNPFPVTQYDIDLLPDFKKLSDVEMDWLQTLNLDVYIPVTAYGRWTGLLALGPKTSGDRYYVDELETLQQLAGQTAVALENARMYEELKIRNTENERLNRELSTANRELARLDQAKSDFISIASHELRTPLTQARGFNDILSEMVKDGSLSKDVGLNLTDNVRRATIKLEKIVSTMLDVSQLDNQTMSLEIYSTTAASIIRLAVEQWEKALLSRKQTLSVSGLDQLPEIRVDSKRMTQVFSNLIQNAIKYTPDGGEIKITGELLSRDGVPEAVMLLVSDNGIGISADDNQKVFEKFYRAGNALLHSTGDMKFMGGGPGLGLTIAKGIVEAHGGAIWLESPGCDEKTFPGSKFYIVLPLQNTQTGVRKVLFPQSRS